MFDGRYAEGLSDPFPSRELLVRAADDFRKRETEKMLHRFHNPPPTLVEYIAEKGGRLVKDLKRKTQDRIAREAGVSIRPLEPGENDPFIYPPHVSGLEAAVGPFVRHVEGRRRRLVELFTSFSPMDEKGHRLYSSMTLRERKIEDSIMPCPGCRE